MSRPSLKDMQKLLSACIEADSYGVDGSDFLRCKVCGNESGAVLLARPGWHEASCPVPGLRRKYGYRGQHAALAKEPTP
jgi:hypothetical protein